MSDGKGKYIPSLERLEKVAKELPSPENITVDTYQVMVGGRHALEFRKIKYKSKEGRGTRWVYEGKVLVK